MYNLICPPVEILFSDNIAFVRVDTFIGGPAWHCSVLC